MTDPSGRAMSRRQWLQAGTLVSTAMALGPMTTGHVEAESVFPENQGTGIYLTDLSQCRPPAALSRKAMRNHWRLLDYETDKFKGVMLVAGVNTAAPQITYSFNHRGWHAVYIGLCSYFAHETRVEVKLKQDSAFCLIRESLRGKKQINDIFWKYADLTGEEITIRQFCSQVVPENPASVGNPCNSIWLAYIKLIALSEREEKNLKASRTRKDTRRLFAHDDGWTYASFLRPTTEAEIRRELEPLRDTDFARLYWEAGDGDHLSYPTKIGFMMTDEWIQDPHRLEDRLVAESFQALRKKGIDPLRVAMDYAHEIGLEFHASYRLAGFHFPPPFEQWNEGGLYDKHPEWRGVDRKGRPTPRLSYAFPEVRSFVVSVLKEIASYPVDGICLLYNRRPPLLEYEPPILDGFKATYGTDPRQLDERDQRWLAYRATFLTQFMREVRKAMGETQREQKRSKPFEISAIVMSSRQENLYYGMDLETWIREDLVDTIIPYSSLEGLDSSSDSWTNPQDAEFFLRITRGTSCKLALNLMPRQLSPKEYRRRAHALYESGIEYLFLWDIDQRNDFSLSWQALRRLGHREELKDWVRSGSPDLERSYSRLLRLGDWDLSYGTPG